jgi:hypothetical protein
MRIGGVVWFDDYLFRIGFMGREGVSDEIDKWTKLGFEAVGTRAESEEKYWKDLCVHEIMYHGVTMPCDWLESMPNSNAVRYKREENEDFDNEEIVEPRSLAMQLIRENLYVEEEETKTKQKIQQIIFYSVVAAVIFALVYAFIR